MTYETQNVQKKLLSLYHVVVKEFKQAPTDPIS